MPESLAGNNAFRRALADIDDGPLNHMWETFWRMVHDQPGMTRGRAMTTFEHFVCLAMSGVQQQTGEVSAWRVREWLEDALEDGYTPEMICMQMEALHRDTREMQRSVLNALGSYIYTFAIQLSLVFG